MEEVQATFGYFKPEEPKAPKEPIDWTNYNKSQTREKIFFMRLLRELCDLIEEPPHYNQGRKPVNSSDMIYSLALKTYETHSSRRCCGELKLANKAGFIQKPFHFNTLLKYLESTDLTGILQELIQLSSLPLKQVETSFAVDSTGFATSVYERWFDAKYRFKDSLKKFRKCHAMCGVKTHIITSVEVSEGYAHDSPYFETLANKTGEQFIIKEVSADKAYSSRENLKTVSKLGGVAFIPFRSNASASADGTMLWTKMFNYFKDNRKEFLERYHKRSNIESVFRMVKARFGPSIRCKNTTSQDNEVLLKILCHNICVLTQEIFMNNIEVDFKKCAVEASCT